MLIKLPNNKLNNKITFRRSKESYKHEFSSIIPFYNNFIRVKPKTLWAVAALFGCLCLLSSSKASAASVSITVTGNSSQSIDLLPTATTCDFKKSGNIEVTVSATDTTAGYTLTIEDKNNDNQRLTGTNNNNYLTSISSATTESDFSSNLTTANSNYDNKWGFLPSKLNGEANTNYQPGPKKTTATTIDVTDNPSAQTYTFAIGARVNNNQAKDTYTGTFTLAASVSATPYFIGFVDALDKMPTPLSGDAEGDSVTIPSFSSTTPTKPGYTFKGWCRTATTDNTCSTVTAGSTNPDIPVTGGSYNLSDGAVTNLYAMWEKAMPSTYGLKTFDEAFSYYGITKSGSYYTMQQMTSCVCNAVKYGAETQLKDNRDSTIYWVAKEADGKCWMTQNLDLALTSTALTNANTDLNSKTSWTPPTTARTAGRTISGTKVTGWTDDYNIPYSAEGGDIYFYNSDSTSYDTQYASLSACASAGHTEADCKHYHAGNYYNWSAAVASDNTSSYTAFLMTAPDSICPKGWRLPIGLSGATRSATTSEFANLLYESGIIPQITSSGSGAYATNGFNKIRTGPLYFARSNSVHESSGPGSLGNGGIYWSSSVSGNYYVYGLGIYSGYVYPVFSDGLYGNSHRSYGFSVRCVAR